MPGALLSLTDRRGKPLGTGLYSSASQIAVRLLARNGIAPGQLLPLIRQRILDALAFRRQLVRDSDAYRLIFSEADLLPGLIADRYADLLTLQVLTQAMDLDPVRETVTRTLAEELRPAAIVERVDSRIRELEQLPPREDQVVFAGQDFDRFQPEWLALSLRRACRAEERRLSRSA